MIFRSLGKLPPDFDEARYLAANVDVRKAVEAGTVLSGAAHFLKFGRVEGRDPNPILPSDKPAKTETVLGLDGIALPPSDLMFLVTNGTDPVRFQEAGAADLSAVRLAVKEAGIELPTSQLSVLDWGCGCGRLARHWADEPGGVDFYGCDINETLVAWCRDKLSFGHFTVSGFTPPLSYESESFDLIYGISVFTHLTLEEHYSWMREIYRVLKPGGVAVLTAHGTTMLPQILQGAHATFETPGSKVRVNLIDEDAFVCLEREAGSNASGNVLTGNIFGKIFFPFNILFRSPRYGLMGIQDTYVIRRKSSLPLVMIDVLAVLNLEGLRYSHDFNIDLQGSHNFCALINVSELYWAASAQLMLYIDDNSIPIITSARIALPHSISWTSIDCAFATISLSNIPFYNGKVRARIEINGDHVLDRSVLKITKVMLF